MGGFPKSVVVASFSLLLMATQLGRIAAAKGILYDDDDDGLEDDLIRICACFWFAPGDWPRIHRPVILLEPLSNPQLCNPITRFTNPVADTNEVGAVFISLSCYNDPSAA